MKKLNHPDVTLKVLSDNELDSISGGATVQEIVAGTLNNAIFTVNNAVSGALTDVLPLIGIPPITGLPS
jgi:bacteriocin-like protein